jgi:dCMP deaminase
MNKQEKYDRTYLNMAKEWAKLSHCSRKKVGALIVKNGQIISDGFNGSPSNIDNNCEDCNGDTHWYVLHAEANAILKCAKYGNSCDGATLYITCSPCKNCTSIILQAGLKRIVYIEEYRDLSGLEFLKKMGIEIICLTL